MSQIAWLFPVLFMIHELEEIIGFSKWLKKNSGFLVQKFPKSKRMVENFTTEAFSIAVLEEYLFCICITFLSIYFDSYYIWLGFFIAFVLHLLVHIGQGIVFRGYIPSIFTSILLLPPCLGIILKALEINDFSKFHLILSCILCTFFMVVNLKIAHFLMERYSRLKK